MLRFEDPHLAVKAAGLQFGSPLGLAAGFDKNGRGIALWEAFGFGHVEIGSVSAQYSAGNPKPRLWRLPEDEAVVVYYGLPNEGAEKVGQRLASIRREVPLGINIVNTNRGPGAEAETDEGIVADYAASVKRLDRHADYLCLNLSCPNTCDGRAFVSETKRVRQLLGAIGEVRPENAVFLKVAPFAEIEGLEKFLEAVDGYDFVRGFSINLPPGKPPGLKTAPERWQSWPGAVSGRPAEAAANRAIAEMYQRMDRRRHIIIGSGGVFSAEDAWRKIQLGATLVQCLTAMIYEGPRVVRAIGEGLAGIAAREGLKSVQEAVGSG
jgi:dihydroorotate dehydrogenase (fumarate)/dihydroorotate dehydrogenase